MRKERSPIQNKTLAKRISRKRKQMSNRIKTRKRIRMPWRDLLKESLARHQKRKA